MKSTTLLAFSLGLGAMAAPQAPAQSCDPKNQPGGLGLGTAVPMKPEDIPKGCSDFEILIARGTTERNNDTPDTPPGKFGIVVGDPLVNAITKLMPNVRGYPVQYPADMSLSGPNQGSTDIVKRLTQQDKDCPNQKFALVGYSQGAMITHLAASKIPPQIQDKVLAIVMFGDPYLRLSPAFPGNLKTKPLLENCNVRDPVCTSGSCFDPHLEYWKPEWQGDSAKFIVDAFRGVKVESRTNKAPPALVNLE